MTAPAVPYAEHFVYAVAGRQIEKLVATLESQIGTDSPQQKGDVQTAFNLACLKGAGLPEGPYNYLYEKLERPGGEGIIVKCPRINGSFYVPDDACPIKKWEYEQAVELSAPTVANIQNFKL